MSMFGVFIDKVRIGTVMKVAGNPADRRWVAYSVKHRNGEENKQEFPTKKRAENWLVEQFENAEIPW
ncbi:MAG: hypothetical protein ACTHLK_23170 [Brucella intermedia]